MIISKVHFVEEGDVQEIDFMILPKIGETILYGRKDIYLEYTVKKIIHKVNMDSNEGNQVLEIFISKLR